MLKPPTRDKRRKKNSAWLYSFPVSAAKVLWKQKIVQRKYSIIFSWSLIYFTVVCTRRQFITKNNTNDTNDSLKILEKRWKVLESGFNYCSYLGIVEILFSALPLSSRGSLRNVPTNSAAVQVQLSVYVCVPINNIETFVMQNNHKRMQNYQNLIVSYVTLSLSGFTKNITVK